MPTAPFPRPDRRPAPRPPSAAPSIGSRSRRDNVAPARPAPALDARRRQRGSAGQFLPRGKATCAGASSERKRRAKGLAGDVPARRWVEDWKHPTLMEITPFPSSYQDERVSMSDKPKAHDRALESADPQDQAAPQAPASDNP